MSTSLMADKDSDTNGRRQYVLREVPKEEKQSERLCRLDQHRQKPLTATQANRQQGLQKMA